MRVREGGFTHEESVVAAVRSDVEFGDGAGLTSAVLCSGDHDKGMKNGTTLLFPST